MLSADDRLEILGLYARYCHGFDTADSDAVAACFSEGCVFQTGRKTHEGRQAVRSYVAELAAELPGQRHQTSDALIEEIPGRPDAAHGRAYYFFSQVLEGRLVPIMTGVYESEFARVDGRWVIDRHRGIADGLPSRPAHDA
jgi:SnoaL-like domain